MPEAEPVRPPVPLRRDEIIEAQTEEPKIAGAEPDEWWSAAATESQPQTDFQPQSAFEAQPEFQSEEAFQAPEMATAWPEQAPVATNDDVDFAQPAEVAPIPEAQPEVAERSFPEESFAGGAFFSGDTRFFSLNWALRSIGKGKLSGVLRAYWDKDPVELYAQNGQIVLVTTRDPELYCAEAPITLVNVDAERIAAARAQQREDGCPMFLTLAQENLILREPALQLVQHYGQKLFAHLWTAQRVRFVFEQNTTLPAYANDLPADPELDHWTLATLRLIQFQDLGSPQNYDLNSIPAYTKDGFERIQRLKLTVAEAQFASQFNGARSVAQIAKNLRLDIKFARVTLFRFLVLEIVECWPPTTTAKPERKGLFSRFGVGGD